MSEFRMGILAVELRKCSNLSFCVISRKTGNEFSDLIYPPEMEVTKPHLH